MTKVSKTQSIESIIKTLKNSTKATNNKEVKELKTIIATLEEKLELTTLQCNKKDKLISTFKSGIIRWDKGSILISEIYCVEEDGDNITIKFKNGKERIFGYDFMYLREII